MHKVYPQLADLHTDTHRFKDTHREKESQYRGPKAIKCKAQYICDISNMQDKNKFTTTIFWLVLIL